MCTLSDTLPAVPSFMLTRPLVSDVTEYRKALSCFATGVTVVTARWQDSDWGMTCNSFSSVSLEPKLVLWSIRKAASNLDAFIHSGGFTISVLSDEQTATAKQFSTGDMAARFSGVSTTRQTNHRLRLNDTVAWFDCEVQQRVDAGDHHIVIGQVQDFGWHNESQALTYWRSQFGRFEPLAT
jgi:flavin reductase (DIM6/NTAB) family NADH-FMN oxidoreductase RutF